MVSELFIDAKLVPDHSDYRRAQDKVEPGHSSSYEIECLPLRKHAYTSRLKILPPKNENFQIKNSDIFHISAQNIDCGYLLELPQRGGSNEYPQSMFLS